MNNFQRAKVLPASLLLITGLFADSVLAQDPIVNGSFETGDYTGWTLAEIPSNSRTSGIWGIATNGQTINRREPIFDFHDGFAFGSNSLGLPHTYTATDGNYVALQLQNGSQLHTMSQDITLCSRSTDLTWDMEYRTNIGFRNTQYTAVELRNPATNAVLATLFRTNPGDPTSSAMSPRSADISAYAGQTVRLQVTHQVQNFFFDAAWDNFRIESCEKIIVDVDIKPGSFPNSINLGSGGATPVAILGSATLDVNDIDTTSLTLGTSGVKTVGKKDKQLCSVADVSGDFTGGPEGAPDGYNDLVCHFVTMSIVPEGGDTEALLSGALIDATRIEGTDSVNIVP